MTLPRTRTRPKQTDDRTDALMSCQRTSRVSVLLCARWICPWGGRAYLLGRKVLHNIYAGKWPTIYKDTRHFGTSFCPAVVANKMNFLNARQSRKLQFPIAKQSNLIKRIPNAIQVCVCGCVVGSCVTRADSNLFCLV